MDSEVARPLGHVLSVARAALHRLPVTGPSIDAASIFLNHCRNAWKPGACSHLLKADGCCHCCRIVRACPRWAYEVRISRNRRLVSDVDEISSNIGQLFSSLPGNKQRSCLLLCQAIESYLCLLPAMPEKVGHTLEDQGSESCQSEAAAVGWHDTSSKQSSFKRPVKLLNLPLSLLTAREKIGETRLPSLPTSGKTSPSISSAHGATSLLRCKSFNATFGVM